MSSPVSVAYQARTGINSRADYEALYERSIKDPAGFWAEFARQFHWEKPVRSPPLSTAWLHLQHCMMVPAPDRASPSAAAVCQW